MIMYPVAPCGFDMRNRRPAYSLPQGVRTALSKTPSGLRHGGVDKSRRAAHAAITDKPARKTRLC